MSQDEALGAFERTFEILANPAYNDSQKLYACIAFLQYAPLEFFADYPRECKAVVSGAFQYGATWADVADAASIKVDEARAGGWTSRPPGRPPRLATRRTRPVTTKERGVPGCA